MAFKMKGSGFYGKGNQSPAKAKGDPKKEKGLTKAQVRAAMANQMGTAEVETVSKNTKSKLGAMSGMSADERKAMQRDARDVYINSDDGTGTRGNPRSTDKSAENLRATNSAADMISKGSRRDGESWATAEDSRTRTVPRKSPAKKKKKY